MSLTPSTMLPLGTKAPDFSLPDVDGTIVTRKQFADTKGLVVAFICNHCPYVVNLREQFAEFARDYQTRGIAIVAIASNDAKGYPADGPDKMKEQAASIGYDFPYLHDATQEVAKAYRAACTPDFFLFETTGTTHTLVYRGQFDASRAGNGVTPTGENLRVACDALLADQKSLATQIPSVGCNIKWRAGNAPDYFSG